MKNKISQGFRFMTHGGIVKNLSCYMCGQMKKTLYRAGVDHETKEQKYACEDCKERAILQVRQRNLSKVSKKN